MNLTFVYTQFILKRYSNVSNSACSKRGVTSTVVRLDKHSDGRPFI